VEAGVFFTEGNEGEAGRLENARKAPADAVTGILYGCCIAPEEQDGLELRRPMTNVLYQPPSQVRNGDLVYGELCRAAVEDLPSCLVNHCCFEVVQIAHGDCCCDLDFVAGARAAICRMRIARQVHLRGMMLEGWMALGLVQQEGAAEDAGRVRGYERLRLAVPDMHFDWFLREGQTLIFVMAGQEALLQLAGSDAVEAGARVTLQHGVDRAMLQADPAVLAGAGQALVDLLEDARRGELEGSGGVFGRAVLEAMFVLVDGAEHADEGYPAAEVLVRRAHQAVGELPRRFSIPELCGKLRVSHSSLREAFIKVVGVAPHAYFVRQRLNAVRHQLAQAHPDRQTVTTVALELGFTELGRFAQRYRDFFGENPSQTLQRPRRVIKPVPV
jgi:AraC-like DNA-binding protein